MLVRSVVRVREPQLTTAKLVAPIRGAWGSYIVDRIHEQKAGQDEVYTETCTPLVEAFLQGTDCTVIAYGASQTGKTFTLEGSTGGVQPNRITDGLIQRTAVALIKGLTASSRQRYRLSASYCALSAGTDANLMDLLVGGTSVSSPCIIASLRDSSAAASIERLVQLPLDHADDIYTVIKQGQHIRTQAQRPTAHTMLTLQLLERSAAGEVTRTTFSFIELVAPEPKDPLGHPIVTDPAVARSLSLAFTSLTSVITALKQQQLQQANSGESSSTGGHVPWRDSPLTRWLQPCLSKAQQVVVIGTVAPGPEAAPDTLATLSFVSRLRSRAEGINVTATWDSANSPFAAVGGGAPSGRSRSVSPLSRTAVLAGTTAAAAVAAASASRAAAAAEQRPQPAQERSFSITSVGGASERLSLHSTYEVRPASTSDVATPADAAKAPLRFASPPRMPPALTPMPSATPDAVTPLPERVSSPTDAWMPSYNSSAGTTTTSKTRPPALSAPVIASVGPQQRDGDTSSISLTNPSSPPRSTRATPVPQPLQYNSPRGRYGSISRASGALDAGVGSSNASVAATGSAAAAVTPASAAAGRSRSPSAVPSALGGSSSGARASLPVSGTPVSVAEAKVVGSGTPSESDVAAYVEVMRALKQVGGNTQAELLLEHMLRSLGDVRRSLAYERDEARLAKAELSALREQQRAHESSAATAAVDAATAALAHQKQRSAVEEEARQLRRQLEGAQQQRDDLIHRLGQMSLGETKELEWQLQQQRYERQLANLQDDLNTKLNALSTMAAQLSDAKHAADVARAERDKAQAQVVELTDRLQVQVRSLGEDTSRLKAKAAEAAEKAEREEATRRATEVALAQLRAKVDSSSRTSETSQLQGHVQQLQHQLQDANSVIEGLRAERNKLQELKWQTDEQVRELNATLEEARTAAQRAELECRVAVTRAEADARSASAAATTAAAEVGTARAQCDALRSQAAQLQAAFEEQKRLESSAVRDIKEMESMLREFDRDLEVHAPPLWREMRAERADALLMQPEGAALAPAARWRPVMRTVLAGIKRQLAQEGDLREARDRLQQQVAMLEGQLAKADEVAAALSAHQTLRVQHLAQIDECTARIKQLEEALLAASQENERLAGLQLELRLKEEQLRAAVGDREALQGSASQAAGLQAELRERDNLLDRLWGEVRQARAALALRKSAAAADASPSGVNRSLAALLGVDDDVSPRLRADPASGAATANDVILHWADASCQERALRIMTELRVQVVRASAELSDLRRLPQDLDAARSAASAAHGRVSQLESEVSDLRGRLGALQTAHAALESAHGEVGDARVSLVQQVGDLERQLSQARGEVLALTRQLAAIKEELREAQADRDKAKEHASQLERHAAEAVRQIEMHAAEAEHAKGSAQHSSGELSNVQARAKLLEGQLQDALAKANALSTRLSATEKALSDANARATDLNSRLALAETDARLKVQELMAKVSAAEDSEKMAHTTHREAVERLEWRLKEVTAESNRLAAEVEALRGERMQTALKVEDAERDAMAARARVQDAEYVQKQLQGVLAERDTLHEQLRQARNSGLQADQELRHCRRELELVKAELERTASERMTLAAEVEASRLDSVVSAALARNKAVLGVKTPAAGLGSSPGAMAAAAAAAPLLAPVGTSAGHGGYVALNTRGALGSSTTSHIGAGSAVGLSGLRAPGSAPSALYTSPSLFAGTSAGVTAAPGAYSGTPGSRHSAAAAALAQLGLTPLPTQPRFSPSPR